MSELQNEVTGQLMIPVVIAGLLIYYAVKLLVFKDVSSIRPAGWKPLKEEHKEEYAREAGILMLIFGACSLIAAILMLFVIPIGLIFITLAIIGVFYRFKTIEEKYT